MTVSSVKIQFLRGVSWLALFKFISQMFSWAITIIIARILVPTDYGLMAMATIMTGYAEIFSEMGLGAAIIQKDTIKDQELSSIFWFALFISALLSVTCFPVSYLTASLMKEPAVIPLTQTVSVLFVLSGLQIVPKNLIKKELDFKKIGIMEMLSTAISLIGMLVIAVYGGGVWSLIYGRILRAVAMLCMLYCSAKWRPTSHFNFAEIKHYMNFGIKMVFSRSIFYVWEKSDRFFAGRMLSAIHLGYYSYAMQLAQIPTEKIVTLINQVSFPAFAKLQNHSSEFKDFYLKAVKIISILVFPLFVGGFLIGGDLVKILLNEQWYPMIFLFRCICLSQIITALNAINNFVHAAQGRPQWGIYFHLCCALTMPVSFYFSLKHGLNTIIIPWLTVYLVICIGWILITINKIGISVMEYLYNMKASLISTIIMALSVMLLKYNIIPVYCYDRHIWFTFCLSVACGGLFYILSIFLLDKSTVKTFKKIFVRN